ncbi:helix-turn-helix domain-containing protein [Escherichia coli]|uniref:helix-turn-helix domain-containing protein n=1 Tax=Escherichia coli TaxID=562 RepID=UPI0019195F5B|nr:helix-turn-helix domain-containing protein [Escherichia coli]CAD5735668.1 transcriptional activator [Escherichia coli]CAD5792685.1 transcriptional activator [Escherichia coli]
MGHESNSLNNSNLTFEEGCVSCDSSLGLKNIQLYNCVFIYLKNARLLIKTKDGKSIVINPESICYIEKNTVIDIELYTFGYGVPYEIYHIHSNMLNYVYKVMEPLLSSTIKDKYERVKIFNYPANEIDRKIFEDLIKGELPQHRKIYKISYILSKFSNVESLVYSLSVSTETTFTEKIKNIIESDLSKTWRLQDFSKKLHISEISIRKKLDKEHNNFNKLYLDIRMHNAVKLITKTDKHINNIAYDVGYTSASYFIKNFKRYFGVTPKQFSLKVKR